MWRGGGSDDLQGRAGSSSNARGVDRWPSANAPILSSGSYSRALYPADVTLCSPLASERIAPSVCSLGAGIAFFTRVHFARPSAAGNKARCLAPAELSSNSIRFQRNNSSPCERPAAPAPARPRPLAASTAAEVCYGLCLIKRGHSHRNQITGPDVHRFGKVVQLQKNTTDVVKRNFTHNYSTLCFFPTQRKCPASGPRPTKPT